MERKIPVLKDLLGAINMMEVPVSDEDLQQSKKEILESIKRAIKQDNAKNRQIMSAYFSLENWLYEQKDKPVEIKSAMLWGGLWVIHEMGSIDWNGMRELYGEFMSKQMDLR